MYEKRYKEFLLLYTYDGNICPDTSKYMELCSALQDIVLLKTHVSVVKANHGTIAD